MSSYRERHRDYGLFVPPDEVETYLALGWTLLDAGPSIDGALLAPPPAKTILVGEVPEFRSWGPSALLFESPPCVGYARPFARGGR